MHIGQSRGKTMVFPWTCGSVVKKVGDVKIMKHHSLKLTTGDIGKSAWAGNNKRKHSKYRKWEQKEVTKIAFASHKYKSKYKDGNLGHLYRHWLDTDKVPDVLTKLEQG